MIVEKRVYSIKPGMIGAYLDLYEREGLAVQSSHLGNLVGYFTSDIGRLSQITHMWGYADMVDRAERRSRLFADERWIKVVTQLYTMIDHMENEILIPTSFSPIR